MQQEERPWGKFEILADEPSHKVKRLTINPRQAISYQYHSRRDECWTVIEGEGIVTLNDDEVPVMATSHVFIPAGAKHRILNNTDAPLVLIEVQLGTYFGEDDIVRLSDAYGRV